MDPGQAAHHRVVLDPHVTGDGAQAGDDHVGADLAVVTDVHAVHHHGVVADARAAAALAGPDVDHRMLADRRAPADHQLGALPREAVVLGLLAEHREGEHPAAFADRGAPGHVGMRSQHHARGELDFGAHVGLGSDLDVLGQLRAGLDDGCGMDARQPLSSSSC